jgi:hypothetical protein
MTFEQEEALYDFLMDRIEPFSLKEVTAAVRAKDSHRYGRLSNEIAFLINTQLLAFEISTNKWLTRRGCFFDARFVIAPTRIELLNGILIPGHRFVPFANPNHLPNEYQFFWNGKELSFTNTEASPEEIYPYYSILGEEFAPQYISQENDENADAFNDDPYEDPVEVSIKTIDMRRFYRETGFIPGDRIVVTINDWKSSAFNFERVSKDEWNDAELNSWLLAAEAGFKKSFETIGFDCTTEEQVAWAYFSGGERMRDVPAFSLEDFLYNKTDKIETIQYGIESRFWFAGKEIPDFKRLEGIRTQSDETPLEAALLQLNIPVSEFVVQSYVRDSLFRNDVDVAQVLQRIVPTSVKANKWYLEMLAANIIETYKEFKPKYSLFTDQKAGPIRQRVAELHTAVIDLSTRLERGETDARWLPEHAFIILSQIQRHASGILERLDIDEPPDENELSAIDNSLESMCDTFDDIKDMINKSLDNYRRSNITLVKLDSAPEFDWRSIQVSIGGTEVWRRLVIPPRITLGQLHRLIQLLFNWKEIYPHSFIIDCPQGQNSFTGKDKDIKETSSIASLIAAGASEFIYEYGSHWTVKIIVLSIYNASEGEKAHCVTGENAAPLETIEGPLRFRRFISALDSSNAIERENAKDHLGRNFKFNEFNLDKCNERLKTIAGTI